MIDHPPCPGNCKQGNTAKKQSLESHKITEERATFTDGFVKQVLPLLQIHDIFQHLYKMLKIRAKYNSKGNQQGQEQREDHIIHQLPVP